MKQYISNNFKRVFEPHIISQNLRLQKL